MKQRVLTAFLCAAFASCVSAQGVGTVMADTNGTVRTPARLEARIAHVESLHALGPRLALIEGQTNNWRQAWTWGNHAAAGYLPAASWQSWLSTNTYVRAELDQTALAALAAFAETNNLTRWQDASDTSIWWEAKGGTNLTAYETELLNTWVIWSNAFPSIKHEMTGLPDAPVTEDPPTFLSWGTVSGVFSGSIVASFGTYNWNVETPFGGGGYGDSLGIVKDIFTISYMPYEVITNVVGTYNLTTGNVWQAVGEAKDAADAAQLAADQAATMINYHTTLDAAPHAGKFVTPAQLTNAIYLTMPRILLFDYTAVVGDTLQLFVRSIFEAMDPYSTPYAMVSAVGYSYPRFYEITPVSTGAVALSAISRSLDAAIAITNTAIVTVVSAGQSPSSNINVLCVGDSLTANGYWPAEFRRRLCGSGGAPAASAFSNITFIGDAAALTAGDTNTLFTGHGGFSYPIYTGDALTTYGHVVKGAFDKDRRDVTSVWTNAAGASFEIEYVSTNKAIRDMTVNGGLETLSGGTFGAPWSAVGTADIDHSVVRSGTNSACVTGGAGTYLDPSVNYDANLSSGTYKLSFFAAGESAGGYYSVLVNGSTYAIAWTSIGALSESWKKVEATFTLSEASNVKIFLDNPNAAGTKIYYDDLSLIWTDPSITNSIKLHGYNLASTGTLYHAYGATNTSPIVYTSATDEPASPFWLTESNRFSFADWSVRNGFSDIDACYVMLGWNSLAVGKTAADHAAEIGYAAKFIDQLHADFPACQVRVMGQQIPSPNGGLGTSYGSTGLYVLSSDYYQAVQAMNGLRLAYRDMCATRQSWCRYIDVASQFDSENNMPVGSYPVNTRNAQTEPRGVNGVHPALSGYLQIADAAWRDFIRSFCQ